MNVELKNFRNVASLMKEWRNATEIVGRDKFSICYEIYDFRLPVPTASTIIFGYNIYNNYRSLRSLLVRLNNIDNNYIKIKSDIGTAQVVDLPPLSKYERSPKTQELRIFIKKDQVAKALHIIDIYFYTANDANINIDEYISQIRNNNDINSIRDICVMKGDKEMNTEENEVVAVTVENTTIEDLLESDSDNNKIESTAEEDSVEEYEESTTTQAPVEEVVKYEECDEISKETIEPIIEKHVEKIFEKMSEEIKNRKSESYVINTKLISIVTKLAEIEKQLETLHNLIEHKAGVKSTTPSFNNMDELSAWINDVIENYNKIEVLKNLLNK